MCIVFNAVQDCTNFILLVCISLRLYVISVSKLITRAFFKDLYSNFFLGTLTPQIPQNLADVRYKQLFGQVIWNNHDIYKQVNNLFAASALNLTKLIKLNFDILDKTKTVTSFESSAWIKNLYSLQKFTTHQTLYSDYNLYFLMRGYEVQTQKQTIDTFFLTNLEANYISIFSENQFYQTPHKPNPNKNFINNFSPQNILANCNFLSQKNNIFTNSNLTNNLETFKEERWFHKNSMTDNLLIPNTYLLTQSKFYLGLNMLYLKHPLTNYWLPTKTENLNFKDSFTKLQNLNQSLYPSFFQKKQSNLTTSNFVLPFLKNVNYIENSRIWLSHKQFFTAQINLNLLSFLPIPNPNIVNPRPKQKQYTNSLPYHLNTNLVLTTLNQLNLTPSAHTYNKPNMESIYNGITSGKFGNWNPPTVNYSKRPHFDPNYVSIFQETTTNYSSLLEKLYPFPKSRLPSINECVQSWQKALSTPLPHNLNLDILSTSEIMSKIILNMYVIAPSATRTNTIPHGNPIKNTWLFFSLNLGQKDLLKHNNIPFLFNLSTNSSFTVKNFLLFKPLAVTSHIIKSDISNFYL